jgi:hypothetical protein
MRRRIVKKFHYEGVAFEGLLDDTALHSCAAAMDEPHVAKAGGVGCVQVLFNDRRNVAGRERVKVEGAFDGNPQRVLILHSQAVAGFS